MPLGDEFLADLVKHFNEAQPLARRLALSPMIDAVPIAVAISALLLAAKSCHYAAAQQGMKAPPLSTILHLIETVAEGLMREGEKIEKAEEKQV